MHTFGACALIVAITAASLPGCSQSGQRTGAPPPVSQKQEIVAATNIPGERIYLYKTHLLPTGDLIKRWHWDEPWEIKAVNGSVIRRMYSPEGSAQMKQGGPHITVIQDPVRGTIYEAFFVQQTDKAFNLPMTLYFFASRESQSPLFSLSFTDSTTLQCRGGRVSRGHIKTPGIPLPLLETAHWVGIGWQSVAYESC